MSAQAIEKTLTANDTGETGAHQAGICVPKTGGILSFFPQLDPAIKNPRVPIDVIDDAGREWTFSFIYYNGRFFGGTRNEYRLTGMTSYFREFNLKAGDKIIIRRESPRLVRISFRRPHVKGAPLKLSETWKVIEGEF